MKDYEFHPLCLLMPEMSGDDFKLLSKRIKKHGLRDPIVLIDGKILDGRYRYLACREVGVEPRFVELGDSADAEEFSFDRNVARRHFSPSQRAQFALEMGKNGEGARNRAPAKPSNRSIAKAVHVSTSTVDAAAKVAEHGAPELIAAVKVGDVTASDAAKIVNKPPAVQAKAVERVKSGAAKTVKEAVAGKKGHEVAPKYAPFQALDAACGKLLRGIDALNKHQPGAKFHKQALDAQKHVMRILKDWWTATK